MSRIGPDLGRSISSIRMRLVAGLAAASPVVAGPVAADPAAAVPRDAGNSSSS
jgi:hypothetical protein